MFKSVSLMNTSKSRFKYFSFENILWVHKRIFIITISSENFRENLYMGHCQCLVLRPDETKFKTS